MENSFKCDECLKLKSKCKCGKWTYVCENDECFLVKRPSPEPNLVAQQPTQQHNHALRKKH